MFQFRKTISVLTGLALLTHLWMGCNCQHSHAAEPENHHEHQHTSAADHAVESVACTSHKHHHQPSPTACSPWHPDHVHCSCKDTCQYVSVTPVKTPAPDFDLSTIDPLDRNSRQQIDFASWKSWKILTCSLNQTGAAARTFQTLEIWLI